MLKVFCHFNNLSLLTFSLHFFYRVPFNTQFKGWTSTQARENIKSSFSKSIPHFFIFEIVIKAQTNHPIKQFILQYFTLSNGYIERQLNEHHLFRNYYYSSYPIWSQFFFHLSILVFTLLPYTISSLLFRCSNIYSYSKIPPTGTP